MRDRYGRHLFGQSTLVVRRLVEAGVRFVTVHYDACDGYGWDSHVHSDDVKEHLLPTFDQALSALLIDLNERGLLAETLVVAVGEMGRTPIASARWGRGHWSTLFPAVLAARASRTVSFMAAQTRTRLSQSMPLSHLSGSPPRSITPWASIPRCASQIPRAGRSRSLNKRNRCSISLGKSRRRSAGSAW